MNMFTVSSRPCDVKNHIRFDFWEFHPVFDFEKKLLSNDFDTFYSSKNIKLKCNMNSLNEFMQDAMSVIECHWMTLSVKMPWVLITNFDATWMTSSIKHLIDNKLKAYRLRSWSVYNSLNIKVGNQIWRTEKKYFLEEGKDCKNIKVLCQLWRWFKQNRLQFFGQRCKLIK